MEFRKTDIIDINQVMNIIKQAQTYFKHQGIDQWQNNYPNTEIIRKDIENNYSYVLVKEQNIVATAAISFDGEKTYNHIYDGQWITNDDYAVIHRIAVDSNYKGLGLSSEIIKNVEMLCLNRGIHSIKVDTHEENLSMQKMLKKNEFEYCGIIYLEEGSKRIAFEKKLD